MEKKLKNVAVWNQASQTRVHGIAFRKGVTTFKLLGKGDKKKTNVTIVKDFDLYYRFG